MYVLKERHHNDDEIDQYNQNDNTLEYVGVYYSFDVQVLFKPFTELHEMFPIIEARWHHMWVFFHEGA
jgi:hypothetical protein